MLKTFILSPLAGGLAAILGWVAALTLIENMKQSTFDSLQFGYAGLIIGGAAVFSILMLLLGGKSIEPLVLAASAGLGVFLLWDERTLPFNSRNVTERTASGYWFAVTMMVIVLVLLIMGLRVANDSNNRAGG